MSTTLTLELTDDVKAKLGKAATEEGVSEIALAGKALQNYLFVRRFRTLRAKLKAESEREYTDEEIFDLVS